MATGGVPGNGAVRLGLLVATAAAFTLLCLGISACSAGKDRAGVAALLLVLAQVPFSGALLPLPGAAGSLLHPLITAWAGWSGSMDTITQDGVIQAFDRINGTWLASPARAFTILGVHALVGLIVTFAGVRRKHA